MASHSGYSIRDFGRMVEDQRRTEPYVRALERAIGPDSVFVDIGTGTGFFAFLACKLGARRVYAIEPDHAIEIAKLCAIDNIGHDRITWLRDLSTRLELPEQADVIMGDMHGILPFHGSNLASMIDARRRFLKPGGIMLPGRDVLFAVPANAPAEYREVDSPWQHNRHGIDMRRGRSFVANYWWRAPEAAVPPDRLLAEPAPWAVIDYARLESTDAGGEARWVIDKPGEIHGYYVWFNSEFGHDLPIDNSPLLPATAYGRAFFPLAEILSLESGDVLSLRFDAKSTEDDPLIRWDTHVRAANGEEKARFRQSTFNAQPFDREAMQRMSSHHVPELNVAGQADLFILDAMRRSLSLSQIAEDLARAFPQRYANAESALARVARLSAAYSNNVPE